MKKFLKSLLIAIMLVPLSLSLVACGGDQLDAKADVDTNGTYAEVKIEDLKNFEVKESRAFDKGVKTTMTISADSESSFIGALAGSEAINCELNSVIRWTKSTTEDNKTEYKINGFAYRTKTNLNKSTQVSDLYYKDGVTYINVEYGENKVQYQKEVDLQSLITDDEYLGQLESIAQSVDFASFVAELQTELEGSDTIKIEKATSGKYTKWHISIDYATESNGSVDVYYVFKSNKLVGVKSDMEFLGMKISATMEAFDDEIKLPKDAKDYPTTIPSADVLEKFEGLEDLFD